MIATALAASRCCWPLRTACTAEDTAERPRKQRGDEQRSGELEALAGKQGAAPLADGDGLELRHRVHRSIAGSSSSERHMPFKSATVPPGATSASSVPASIER